MKKAVVLAGNYAYSDQILTTIKSVCYHNRDVKFYLLNADFPAEFFIGLRKRLAPLNCEIVNARVEQSRLEHYQTAIHYTVFLRYFVADFVVEGRAIYLDSDMVITGDLTALFEMDMKGKPLAAVKDYGLFRYSHQYKFNAGFQVIDVAYWREQGISEQLIEMTNKLHDQVPDGDQSILNLLFEENWLELSTTYNYITIHSMFYEHRLEREELPVTIHYLTARKPWFPPDQSLFREVWWFYHDLEWSEISDYTSLLPLKLSDITPNFKYKVLIFTHSDQLEQIEYLVQQLPYIQFKIAAWVYMSPRLKSLLQYENVSIHESLAGLESVIENLYRTSDALLDINHFDEVGTTVQQFKDQSKPVLAFDNTVHGKQGQEIFSHEQPEKMVQALQDLVAGKEGIKVKDIDKSLDYILQTACSVARFGDGEIALINGGTIPYQTYDPQLAEEMKAVLSKPSTNSLMICLPDVFENLERYNSSFMYFWQDHLERYQELYQEWCQAPWYGSTFLSRPYIDLNDKSLSAGYFAKLKQIWQDRDILIVEGRNSRSGVGNDLFANAQSIKRILCPSKDAYRKIDQIEQAIVEEAQGRLILLMLGPTAKVLAARLSEKNLQAIDIGHIDSEYEWFKMGVTYKVKLEHKHTAEFNFDEQIQEIDDENYRSQIVKDLSLYSPYSLLILTHSELLENVDYLIEHLPEVQFTIGTHGAASSKSEQLAKYDNVSFYTSVSAAPDTVLADFIDKSIALLDINHEMEYENIIRRYAKTGKPILAFDNTQHGESLQAVFSHKRPEDMVQAIKDLLEREKK